MMTLSPQRTKNARVGKGVARASKRDIEGASKTIYEAIFGGDEFVKIGWRTYKVGRSSVRDLRFVSLSGYTFIEQNPAKGSVWGRLARDGHRILWVMQGGDYVGQVRDGVYHDLSK